MAPRDPDSAARKGGGVWGGGYAQTCRCLGSEATTSAPCSARACSLERRARATGCRESLSRGVSDSGVGGAAHTQCRGDTLIYGTSAGSPKAGPSGSGAWRLGSCRGGKSVLPGKRSLTRQKRPVAVCMVAAETMPTVPIDLSGLSGSSFAGFTGPSGISRSNSKRRSSMTTETAASRSANWSPTHLRSPAPKGIMAWSDAISRFATHSPPSGFILPVLGSKPVRLAGS
mmetsp:Transcript_8342/g.26933  ORF Transcript_8342/g.26933 Transcript_8342/m.26933 type:complete len:229 (-) Transcript_8342:672-1358(-)